MNGVYGERVSVQARPDGRPTRFEWQRRPYAVSAILEHWVVSREWWREPGPASREPELEFWRIEAVPGPGLARAVYELRRDAVTGAWTLRPALRAGRTPQVLDVPHRRP